jgi:hypothetical protein
LCSCCTIGSAKLAAEVDMLSTIQPERTI